MADTIYSVNCGFFDAVNSDRTYTADDMNKPYARLVADGVFATPQGTASDDLQTRGSGAMKVTVKAGRGIFAEKWFETRARSCLTCRQIQVLTRASTASSRR